MTSASSGRHDERFAPIVTPLMQNVPGTSNMQSAAAPRTALLVALSLAAVGASAAAPSAPVPPGLYALTTETLLPHLEEALRYATVQSTRCLAGDAAGSFFPLLQHQALAGCVLTASGRPDTFELTCRNPEAATGLATFEHDPSGLRATLELKMGGKNMTLSQRVVGTRLGDCT